MLELMICEPLPISGARPEPLSAAARNEDEPRIAIGHRIVALEGAHRPRAALVKDIPLDATGIAKRTLVDHLPCDAEKAAEPSRLIVVDECRRPSREKPHPAGLGVKLP